MNGNSKFPPFLNQAGPPLTAITESIAAFAQRSGEAFKSAQAASPAANSGMAAGFAKNVRAAIGAQAAKLDLVTQEEFQIQRALLEKAIAKHAELNTKIAELEAQAADSYAMKNPEIRASSGTPSNTNRADKLN